MNKTKRGRDTHTNVLLHRRDDPATDRLVVMDYVRSGMSRFTKVGHLSVRRVDEIHERWYEHPEKEINESISLRTSNERTKTVLRTQNCQHRVFSDG